MLIHVNLIATKKYHIFVQPLINSIKKFFLLKHKIQIKLFTDNLELDYVGDERVSIVKYQIPSYKFPYATLYRYKIMTDSGVTYIGDYIFYLDVDYLIVDEVGEEILDVLVCVSHPGFHTSREGSWETNQLSTAYTYPERRIQYFAGGTQGGSTKFYYSMMRVLADNIKFDESRNIIAVWHDESHWNKILSELDEKKILTPSYCMPEEEHLRVSWGIDNFIPKILALKKNHQEIRS